MRQVVNSFIMKHSLLFEGATVVVGVSGGPDSLALLHFLATEGKQKKLTLIVAHIDHMLRGIESKEDYDFVKEYCQSREIEFEGRKIDVKAYQQKHNLSLQVAARVCRYQFFAEVMEKHNAHLLALAHHGDDQIETMIMRQIRGAFGFGLAGIPPKRPFYNGFIIRPFLCLSKDEIITYCNKEKLVPRIDQSNFTNKYLRNRIRNEVLPILKKENPAVHLRYQQQSELLREDEFFLEQLAQQLVDKVTVLKEENIFVLSLSTLIAAAVPLQRRAFQLILNYLYKGNIPEITYIHIDQFRILTKNSYPSGSLDFPGGLKIRKSYDNCYLSFSEPIEVINFECHLSIPGIVTFKKGKIISEVTNSLPQIPYSSKNMTICDLEKLQLPLIVRNRKKGDSLSLQGTSGTKKLKSLFIDEKIDRKDRDLWPIVLNGNGEVLWVPNLKRSNIALPTEKTRNFVVLTFKEAEEI